MQNLNEIKKGNIYKSKDNFREVYDVKENYVYYINENGEKFKCLISTFKNWIEKLFLDRSCWICETNMDFIETKEITMLGNCDVYKCSKCGEIVYHPLK